MKKRIIALLLTCILVLVGCSSGGKISTLDDVENALSDYCKGEKTEMMASMVGAEKGLKYTEDDSKFEIYEFDTDSDAYKKIYDTKQCILEGFDMTIDVSAINGPFVLFADEYTNEKELVDAFNALDIKN